MRHRTARKLALLLVLGPSALPLAAQTDGTLDPTFGLVGKQRVAFDRPPDASDSASDIAIQDDGRILLAGTACATPSDCQIATARLHPNGSPDTSFNGDGQAAFAFDPSAIFSSPSAILWRPFDGKVVIVGNVSIPSGQRGGLVRLTADGLFDPTFGPPATPGRILFTLPGGTILAATAAALQSDGRIVVGGFGWQTGFADTDIFIARFTAAGVLDSSFSGDGVYWWGFDLGGDDDDSLHRIAIQPDGKIVALASAAADGGDVDTVIVRLTATGNADSGFGDFGAGRVAWENTDVFGDHVDSPSALRIQPNGRILFGGSSRPVAGSSYFAWFSRLLANGDPDPALVLATPDLLAGGGSEFASDILVQSDGKIVLAASAGDEFVAARFDSTGANLDAAFGSGGVQHVSGWSGADATCLAAALHGGRTMLVGSSWVATDGDFLAVRLRSSLIFRDGFQTGSTVQWSEKVP